MTLVEALKRGFTEDEARAMARKILEKMPESPEWCELGLRLLGELPPERQRVNVIGRQF